MCFICVFRILVVRQTCAGAETELLKAIHPDVRAGGADVLLPFTVKV